MNRQRWIIVLLAAFVVPGLLLTGCAGENADGSDGESMAEKTYVEPGEKDDYYLFYSGGHGGDVRVAGIPSMRHIRTIPVFSQDSSYGYGYSEETKELMGDEFTWGDVHHPALSKTDGEYDGRWLFVNDNAHNRVARISLRDFRTKEIIGPIPNTSGNHGSSFLTENSEYMINASRFATPLPKGTHADVEDYEDEFNGVITGIGVDDESGSMDVKWQIKTPPFQWDLSSTGKNDSSDWFFVSSYNTEMAHDNLEANASQMDKDYTAWVNWKRAEEAYENGNYETIDGVPVIDPAEIDGLMYYVPCAKSPHGMDVGPSGDYIVCGGKLEPSASVFSFDKFQQAVENENFKDTFRGVPVVDGDAVLEGKVPTGLGPLHTQFDGNGNAYTSVFIDSVITKWALPPWDGEMADNPEARVIDKIDVHYNIGHLLAPGSETTDPYGEWVVAMNKHAAGRHIKTGTSIPETSQLIDVTGEEMKMAAESFTDKEPHFAQAIPADELDPIEFYPKKENDNPHAVWTPEEASVERTGPNEVTVEMMAVRSRFEPDKVEAKVGDTIKFYITNTEQTPGMNHGFGLGELDYNLDLEPGSTTEMEITVDEPGVYPFYCTVFCSALHQEMQGYLEVEPRNEA